MKSREVVVSEEPGSGNPWERGKREWAYGLEEVSLFVTSGSCWIAPRRKEVHQKVGVRAWKKREVIKCRGGGVGWGVGGKNPLD